MKNSSISPKGKATVLRLLLLFCLFFMPSLASLQMNQEAKAVIADDPSNYCGVDNTEIVRYLNGQGYTVYKLEPEPGTCNRIATTQNPYRTIVYVSEGIIVGVEDIP